ncbi:Angiotensin-converting enzyme-like protein Ace3 [Anthophora plagiata]
MKDATSKLNNIDRNFVAGVLQFQLYRALCQAAGQRSVDDPRRPLHRCDYYRSPEAGRILGKIMERGSSTPWQETLQEAIGEGTLDASALREYFRPLEDWLRTENLRTGDVVGWSYDGDYCKRSIETAGLQVYGSGFYNDASTINSRTILPGIVTIFLTIFTLR